MAESQDSTKQKMAENPWLVESVHSFLYLKCPECVFDTKYENEDMFQHHAIENHQLSNVLFSDVIYVCPIAIENQILDSIKIENHDNFEELNQSYSSDIAGENSILPHNSHISEIKASSDNLVSKVKCELIEDIENINYSKTAKHVVDMIESCDVAPPSEIQKSDNLMTISDPLQILKRGKNRLKSNASTKNESWKKRKAEKQQLQTYEAAHSFLQPKKKKEKRERKIHNTTKEKRFKCKTCDFETADNGNLKQHVESVHLGIKPFHCKLCECDFSKNSNLKKHIESVHEGKKPFKCKLCDYECARNSYLKTHVESVHEGKKPFKCNLCDYKTAQKAKIKYHVKSVHEGIKRFKCNICDFETAENGNLKYHVKSVHERLKPFKCSICDYKTGQKSDVKRHIESVHEGIKPFKCNLCDYEFATNSKLMQHIKSVHEGIKAFKCNLCDFKTAQKGNLKTHIESLHKGVKPLKPHMFVPK